MKIIAGFHWAILLYGGPFAGKDEFERHFGSKVNSRSIHTGDYCREHHAELAHSGAFLNDGAICNFVIPLVESCPQDTIPVVNKLSTAAQVTIVAHSLVDKGIHVGLDIASIYLNVSEKEMWKRRDFRLKEGRFDDQKPEVVADRIKQFLDQKNSVVEEMERCSKLFIEIDANQSMPLVKAQIDDAIKAMHLNAYKKHSRPQRARGTSNLAAVHSP